MINRGGSSQDSRQTKIYYAHQQLSKVQKQLVVSAVKQDQG